MSRMKARNHPKFNGLSIALFIALATSSTRPITQANADSRQVNEEQTGKALLDFPTRPSGHAQNKDTKNLNSLLIKSEQLLGEGMHEEAAEVAKQACPTMPVDTHGKAIQAFICWLQVGRARDQQGNYAEAQSFLLASRRMYEALPETIRAELPDKNRWLSTLSIALASAYAGQGLTDEANAELRKSKESTNLDTTINWTRIASEIRHRMQDCPNKTAEKCIDTLLRSEEQIIRAKESEAQTEDTLNAELLLFEVRLLLTRNYNALNKHQEAIGVIEEYETRRTDSILTRGEKKLLGLEKLIALNGIGDFQQTALNTHYTDQESDNIREKETDAAIKLELAHAYIALGNQIQAAKHAEQAIRLKSALIQEVTQTLPLSERYQYLDSLISLEAIYSFALKSQAGARIAMLARLNEHGVITEVDKKQLSSTKRQSNNKTTAEDLPLLDINKDNAESAKRRSVILGAALENQVSPTELIRPDDIAKKLPSQSILVEYKRYFPFNPLAKPSQRWGRPRYMAMVLNRNTELIAQDLGPANEIDDLINKALSASEENSSDSTELWANVADKVLTPLRRSLDVSERILVSPDGELNRIPFTAIPLITKIKQKITIVASGRSLSSYMETPRSNKKGQPFVLAAPEYGELNAGRINKDQTLNPISTKPELLQRRDQWLNLPGSSSEGVAINKIIGGSLKVGKDANRETLMRINSPVILHIAAHAYYDRNESRTPSVTEKEQAETSVNPLLRSGIALASAEKDKKGDGDIKGHFTAFEASNLSLEGTEIVVVSGCESGLGSITIGDGVYGLGRGFRIAGTKSTLLSLWQVDDYATADFMMRFYTRLKAGEARDVALRKTQQEFHNGAAGNGLWKDPYYWAAWQLVGDWRPIKGL